MKTIKHNWLIYFLGILLSLWTTSGVKAADPFSSLIQIAQEKLRAQVTQNHQNDLAGQSHLNEYLIYLSPADWVKDQTGTALDADQLLELNQLAQEGMQVEPYTQTGFYMIYIDRFPIAIESLFSAEEIHKFNNLFKLGLRQDIRLLQIQKAKKHMRQSLDMIANSQTWQDFPRPDKALYIFGNFELQFTDQTLHIYGRLLKGAGKLDNEASRKYLADETRGGIDYQTTPYPYLQNKIPRLKTALQKLADGSANLSEDGELEAELTLGDILFDSQITYNQSRRVFQGSVEIKELHKQPITFPRKFVPNAFITIADYVGLSGKTLSIRSGSEIGAKMAQLADQVKICITNPQSPAFIRDFLRKDLSTTAPSDFGHFFRLEAGEMMLWIHFAESGKAEVRFWFAESLIPEVVALLSQERIKLAEQGFVAMMQTYKAISEILAASLKGLKIPDRFWNPETQGYPEYMSTLLAILYADISALDDASPNVSQLQFALFAGAYNQLLDEAASIPELVALLSAYLSESETRAAIHQAIGELSFAQIGQALYQGASGQFQTFAQMDCKSAHLLGKDIVGVLSLVIGLGELKAAVKSGKFIETLGKLALKNGKNYLKLIAQLKNLGVHIVHKSGKTLIYAGKEAKHLIATIKDDILRLEKQLNDLINARLLGTFDEVQLTMPDGRTVTTKVELWQKDGKVYMKGDGKSSIGDLDWGSLLNAKALQKLKSLQLDEQAEKLLFTDLKDAKLRKAINEEPELLEGWKILKKSGLDDAATTPKYLKQFYNTFKNDPLLGEFLEYLQKVNPNIFNHLDDSRAWQGLINGFKEWEELKGINIEKIGYVKKYEDLKLVKDPIGVGQHKAAFEVKGDNQVILLKFHDEIFDQKSKVEIIKEQMTASKELNQVGIPVVEYLGVTYHQGAPSVVMRKHVADHLPFSGLSDALEELILKRKEIVKTMRHDINLIKNKVKKHKLYIEDIQFMVSIKGKVMLHDIEGVHFNVPSEMSRTIEALDDFLDDLSKF